MDRNPISPANPAVQIDTGLRLETAGCNVAVTRVRRIAVIEVNAAVNIGCPLSPPNGACIAVRARKHKLSFMPDRMDEYEYVTGT